MLQYRLVALVLFCVLGPLELTARTQQEQPAAPSLEETLNWLKANIDDEGYDSVGIPVRRTVTLSGCDVTLAKTAARNGLTLSSGRMSLRSIDSVRVTDAPIGTLWTGTFLVFHSGEGRIVVRELGPNFTEGADRFAAVFRWHLGSVQAGSPNTSRELASRLVKAFEHAVSLCGGRLKKELF